MTNYFLKFFCTCGKRWMRPAHNEPKCKTRGSLGATLKMRRCVFYVDAHITNRSTEGNPAGQKCDHERPKKKRRKSQKHAGALCTLYFMEVRCEWSHSRPLRSIVDGTRITFPEVASAGDRVHMRMGQAGSLDCKVVHDRVVFVVT